MWDELAEEPTFVLTGDQDWAPGWTVERQLQIARAAAVPMHLFVTNEDPAIRAADAGLTLGIHPNLLPGSTHGSDADSAIEHCLDLVPGATTARTHAFTESTPWLASLARRGVRADSNTGLMLQPGIVPLMHLSGMLRFPVFLEDDVLLRWAGSAPTVEALAPHLFTPGLKILNFHPALVGINARTPADYEQARAELFSGADPSAFAHGGHGVADLLRDLLEEIRRRRHRVMAFPALVERAEQLFAQAYPDGLCGWRPGAAW
jgi:hypothetical protein